MGKRIIVTLVLVVARLCLETSLAAQATLGRIHSGPESVPGVEFAAATNLSDRNVKATGIVFVPESVPRARAVIVLIERGPTTPMAAQSRFGNTSWRTLSGKCACALLYSPIGHDSSHRFQHGCRCRRAAQCVARWG